MTRRTVVLVSLLVLVAGFAGAHMPEARAVTQGVGARANGTSYPSAYTPTQSDTGSYTSLGQLGSGRYDFESNVSACDVAHGTVTLTGQAVVVRSDGARLG